LGFLKRILGAAEPAPPTGDPVRVAEVEGVLARVRPLLAQDGGDVELVAVEGGRVRVRLVGACTRCWSRDATLQAGLEPALREALPWFETVEAR